MSNGLNLAQIKLQCGLNQRLAVSSRTSVSDFDILWHLLINFTDGAHGGRKRASVVITIEGIQKRAVLSDKSNLRRSGTGIHTEEALAVVIAKTAFFYCMLLMAFGEDRILLFRGKQRIHTLDLKIHLDALCQAVNHLGDRRNGGVCLYIHGSTDGSKQMRVLWCNDMLIGQMKRADKCLF